MLNKNHNIPLTWYKLDTLRYIAKWLLNAVFTSGVENRAFYNFTRAICEPVRNSIESSSKMRNIKQGFIRILVELATLGYRTPPHQNFALLRSIHTVCGYKLKMAENPNLSRLDANGRETAHENEKMNVQNGSRRDVNNLREPHSTATDRCLQRRRARSMPG